MPNDVVLCRIKVKVEVHLDTGGFDPESKDGLLRGLDDLEQFSQRSLFFFVDIRVVLDPAVGFHACRFRIEFVPVG
ncbi:MAG: hypothetical protein O3C17_05300 [Planctomycetota bacterium]|nr:hypothetical protein [Planctomycetota bacterium]